MMCTGVPRRRRENNDATGRHGAVCRFVEARVSPLFPSNMKVCMKVCPMSYGSLSIMHVTKTFDNTFEILLLLLLFYLFHERLHI